MAERADAPARRPRSAPSGCVSETLAAAPTGHGGDRHPRYGRLPSSPFVHRDRALARRASLGPHRLPGGLGVAIRCSFPSMLCLDLEPDLSALTATGEAHSRVFADRAEGCGVAHDRVRHRRGRPDWCSARRRNSPWPAASRTSAREQSGTIDPRRRPSVVPPCRHRDARVSRRHRGRRRDLSTVDLISFRRRSGGGSYVGHVRFRAAGLSRARASREAR